MVHCGIWDWCIVGFVRWVYYQPPPAVGDTHSTEDLTNTSMWKHEGNTGVWTHKVWFWKVISSWIFLLETYLRKAHSAPMVIHLQLQIEGLVQERCNSSALAMELCLSCTNPSRCPLILMNAFVKSNISYESVNISTIYVHLPHYILHFELPPGHLCKVLVSKTIKMLTSWRHAIVIIVTPAGLHGDVSL